LSFKKRVFDLNDCGPVLFFLIGF